MSRRMAPYKWNNKRFDDRRENHYGHNQQQPQQQQNQQNQSAAVQEEINNDDKSSLLDTVEYIVKILIPNQTAWSISSRNEAKVSWMVEKFSSDVRLSRNDDFYPNTSDRICMIIGTKKRISETLEWILGINNDDNENCSAIMLVPKTSLGALLNRGYGIQALRERGNVDIHVPEQNPDCLREVCTTIAGKKQNIVDTIIAIAKIILTDPFSAVCRNVSYEEFNMYLKRKEYSNSLTPNFASMPRIGIQQIPASPMVNTSWMYQQQSSMQNYQNQNIHQQNQFQQQQQYQHQNFIDHHAQQETIEQLSYQPAVYTNQLTNFYYQNNKRHGYRGQQLSPFFQQKQLVEFIAQNNNQLQVEMQVHQQDVQDQLATINQQHQQEKIVAEVDNDKSNTADNVASNNNVGDNETGNPIPSVTSVWRRASSDNWRFGNNRTSSNGQSNVEVIPGIN